MTPSELVRHLFGLAGFVLPGWIVARRMGAAHRWGAAFIISLLLLFSSVFVAGILAVPVRLPSVAAILSLLTGAVWTLAGRVPRARPQAGDSAPGDRVRPPGTGSRLAGAGALLFVLAVVLGATRAALCEWDTPFRWDRLAAMMHELGSFSFYPPITPADFDTYFAVDSIPPLVPFSYWWLYATAGVHLPALAGALIAAQFAVAAAFTHAAAGSLFGPGARWWAAGTLATSLLFVNSIMMGQETGMTAIAVVATVAFLAESGEERGPAPVVMAGLATALGILSREYGWAFLLVGVLMLVWRKAGARSVLLYLGVASLVGAPWYLRTLALTGNPFYSIAVGPLPVNPVYADLVGYYRGVLGISSWGIADWLAPLRHVGVNAAFPLLIGAAACLVLGRRHGYLPLSVAAIFLLWTLSIGYTDGGPLYAARMLTPAIALLSVASGGLLERLSARPPLNLAMRALISAGCAWAFLAALLHPYHPAVLPVRLWPAALSTRYEAAYAREWTALPEILSPGARVLASNPYLHAWLRPRGVQVVPVWSPEVAFVVDRSLAAADVRRRLVDRGIRYLWFEPRAGGDFLVERTRLYQEDLPPLRLLFQAADGSALLELPAGDKGGADRVRH